MVTASPGHRVRSRTEDSPSEAEQPQRRSRHDAPGADALGATGVGDAPMPQAAPLHGDNPASSQSPGLPNAGQGSAATGGESGGGRAQPECLACRGYGNKAHTCELGFLHKLRELANQSLRQQPTPLEVVRDSLPDGLRMCEQTMGDGAPDTLRSVDGICFVVPSGATLEAPPTKEARVHLTPARAAHLVNLERRCARAASSALSMLATPPIGCACAILANPAADRMRVRICRLPVHQRSSVGVHHAVAETADGRSLPAADVLTVALAAVRAERARCAAVLAENAVLRELTGARGSSARPARDAGEGTAQDAGEGTAQDAGEGTAEAACISTARKPAYMLQKTQLWRRLEQHGDMQHACTQFKHLTGARLTSPCRAAAHRTSASARMHCTASAADRAPESHGVSYPHHRRSDARRAATRS